MRALRYTSQHDHSRIAPATHFGDGFIGDHVTFHNSLDSFAGFYVNKFVDHNSFEIAS